MTTRVLLKCMAIARARVLTPPLTLLPTLATVGCDGQGPPGVGMAGDPSAGVTIHDSAGIEIVENHVPKWPPGRFWSIDPEPEVVLGGDESLDGVDGDSAHLIWDVRGLARLPDGRVAVLSGAARKLFLFEPSGRFSKSIGREGRGPGEFSSPEHLQYLPGDSLVVWEAMYGPVSHFDTTGALLRHRLIDIGAVFAAVGPGNMTEVAIPLADGSFVAQLRPARGDRPPPVGQPYRLPEGHVRIDSAYSAHSFGWWDGLEQIRVDRGGGDVSPMFRLFPVRSRIAGGGQPLSVYISNGDRNEIHQFSIEGVRVRILRNPTDPVPITEEEREAVKKRMYSQWGSDREDWVRSMVEALPPQDFHPPVSGLQVDSEGHLWVRGKAGMEGGQWNVFDPKGRWLGTLPVPLWRVLWIGENFLLGVNHDDASGVKRVEGYRLNRHK